jgi:hypothetical protein
MKSELGGKGRLILIFDRFDKFDREGTPPKA